MMIILTWITRTLKIVLDYIFLRAKDAENYFKIHIDPGYMSSEVFQFSSFPHS